MNKEGYLPSNLDVTLLNYRDYPKNTKIGWRGPMIKWSDVVNGEKIIYLGDSLKKNISRI